MAVIDVTRLLQMYTVTAVQEPRSHNKCPESPHKSTLCRCRTALRNHRPALPAGALRTCPTGNRALSAGSGRRPGAEARPGGAEVCRARLLAARGVGVRSGIFVAFVACGGWVVSEWEFEEVVDYV